ncbi:hypothetical protein SRB17_20100 [Streptomyces sp. RB17]|nr:hypothetical protein [Streptomyces sp. RB17]
MGGAASARPGADLALPTAHRTGLVADRVRLLNRLRDVLTGVFPALERPFARLTFWLTNRGVRSADLVAATALEAARAQRTARPGEDVTARFVADPATRIPAPDARLERIDQQIRDTFRAHPQAEIIESLPGTGPILGAEHVVAAVDLSAYADAGHLASAAGPVPVPRDSGRRTGTMHRPEPHSRRLKLLRDNRVHRASPDCASRRVCAFRSCS